MAGEKDKIQLEQNIFLNFITITFRFIARTISYFWLMLCETVTQFIGNKWNSALRKRVVTLTADEAEWLAAKPFEQMPGHPSLPVFGTIWAMFRLLWVGFDVNRFHEVHKQNFKDYGYIWRFMVPGLPAIVNTARPEDSEILFRNEGRYPERPGFETLKHYRANRPEQFTSDGILIDHGEGWWRIRSKARHAFLNKNKVENYMPVLGNIAEEFITRIRLIRLENNEMRPDFINEMYKWALESVAVVGLNNRLGCLDPNLTPDSEGQKMINAVNNSFLAMNKMEFGLPIWKYIMTPTMRQLFEAQDFFTETAIKYINKTMDDIKKRPADSQEDPSILEELFIQNISPKDAMVMVCDMLIAGIDTTSNSTSFLLYFLAKNPEKQEKLREEIFAIVGPKGSRITSSALEELHYLKACINESLRLMPAAIGNARYANKDLVLSGYRVHKGTLVITAHQLLAQLEEFFPNAKEYIPERWIKGHPLESQHSPYALLPFGFGKRMCVGRRLAELEMEQLTIKILQNFKIEYHYQDISCFTRTVNVPDQPLRFRFIDL